MEPSDIGIRIRDTTSVTSLIQHATLGYFKIDMTITNKVTTDRIIS